MLPPTMSDHSAKVKTFLLSNRQHLVYNLYRGQQWRVNTVSQEDVHKLFEVCEGS
jgi:hypothetical protein